MTAAAALLAAVALPPVLADAGTAALLAIAAPPTMLADAAATALLAILALPPVLADAAAAALLARAAPPPVRTRGRHICPDTRQRAPRTRAPIRCSTPGQKRPVRGGK